MTKLTPASPLRVAFIVAAATASLGAWCPGGEDVLRVVSPTHGGSITVEATLDGSPAVGIHVYIGGTEGILLDSDAERLEGNYFFDTFPREDLIRARTGETGAGGRFTTSNAFLPGTYLVKIRPPEGADCTPPIQTVTVETGGNAIASFTCTSRQPAGTIKLLVTSGGSPLSGANVTLSGPGGTRTGTTGSNGTVPFTDLPPGQYAAGATVTDQTCTSPTIDLQPGQTADLTVTCDPNPVRVTLTPAGPINLKRGESVQLTATVTGGLPGTPRTLLWSSSNGSVARCDDTSAATNRVVALAPGTATITATSTADPTRSASVVVNVTQ